MSSRETTELTPVSTNENKENKTVLNREVIIMKGLPGSGKSTRARQFGMPVVSADHFFYVEGEYRFNPTKILDAHAACQCKAIEFFSAQTSFVVDNTNVRRAEYAVYVKLAEKFGFDVRFVQMHGDNVSDELLRVYYDRQVHKVPLLVMQRMRDEFESLEPKYLNHVGLDDAGALQAEFHCPEEADWLTAVGQLRGIRERITPSAILDVAASHAQVNRAKAITWLRLFYRGMELRDLNEWVKLMERKHELGIGDFPTMEAGGYVLKYFAGEKLR